MSFYPGQHVVCVDDSLPEECFRWLHPTWLEKNRVYTIRQVDVWNGVLGVLLEEIRSRFNVLQNGEQLFLASRFRPLDEKRLDIFRAHLAPSPKEKEAA